MKLCIDHVLVDQCLIQVNSWAGSVFSTTVRNPATFKKELLAPRETLIKAGWYIIQLCLRSSS